jgi:hypothetical protein
MPGKRKIQVNMNLDPELLARVEKYRLNRMFATRSEAIEALLDAGLKVNPEHPVLKGE